MNDAELLFFEKYPNALPLYEKLKERILDEIPGVQMKVQKTQISFINKRFFACVSFVKVRKAKDRPDPWLVVTFGLEYKVESSRIDAATEPYPNRWTHHVLISSVEEVDDKLMDWIKEASDFALRK